MPSCAKLSNEECLKRSDLKWIPGKGCRKKTYDENRAREKKNRRLAVNNTSSIMTPTRQNDGRLTFANNPSNESTIMLATDILTNWFKNFYVRDFDPNIDNVLLSLVQSMLAQHKSQGEIQTYLTRHPGAYVWEAKNNVILPTISANGFTNIQQTNNDDLKVFFAKAIDAIALKLIDKHKVSLNTVQLKHYIVQTAKYIGTNGDMLYKADYEALLRLWSRTTGLDIHQVLMVLMSEFALMFANSIYTTH